MRRRFAFCQLHDCSGWLGLATHSGNSLSVLVGAFSFERAGSARQSDYFQDTGVLAEN